MIPDATGTLRSAPELFRHPQESIDLARQWQELADADEWTQMVHPLCWERQRGNRLNALAGRLDGEDDEEVSHPNLRKREAKAWFEAVASTEIVKASGVLSLAKAYMNDCTFNEWNQECPLLAIIPSDDGQLLTAKQAVFAPEGTLVPDGRHPVARALSDDPETKRILTDVMKVEALDDDLWESVLQEALPNNQWRREEWCFFWRMLRTAPNAVSHKFIKQPSSQIRVRRRDNKWNLADAVLLPGALVSANDTSQNQNVLVDSGLHGEDEALLAALGVCDVPDGETKAQRYGELNEWLEACQTTYKRTHRNAAKKSYLEPVCLTMPKGWELLTELCGAPNAELTKRILARITQGQFGERIKFGHSTVATYPEIDVPHPLPWFILQRGTAQVGDGTVRLTALVGRCDEPAVARLPCIERLSLTHEKLQQAYPQVVPADADICAMWRTLMEAFATPSALAGGTLEDLWNGAAKDAVIPESLRAEAGTIPLAEVLVTGSRDLARRARTQERTVVSLDDNALNLWIGGGARNLAELMSPKWTEQTGPAGLLVSTIPELAQVLQEGIDKTARCQPVGSLELVIDGHADPMPCLMWKNALLLDLAQLELMSRADRFECLLGEVAAAGWLKHEPEEALRILGDSQVDVLRAKVAQGSTLAERLIRAVGNREEPLREAFENLEEKDFFQRCNLLQLAELTLAQLGPATLSTLKDTLEEEGLKPPTRWNTSEARTFVDSIGFPQTFAASPKARREAEVFVNGPIDLPSLHDFQNEVFGGIRDLLAKGSTRRRAVVSLPTGGGKTRVTVEAAVRLVLEPEDKRRSVVWIAQTDELCEQAVQAFRQVWINLGAKSTDLRIIRLWGGHPNPAVQERDKPVVVVSSIQTLNSRMGTDGLAWLREPGLLVVDECHHAITRSYSNLLRWLDAEAPKAGAAEKDEPPILGLSATPFRTDDEESQRLAKRFDNLWFPPNQKELHTRLCSQGVLTRADYEELESGTKLLDEEMEQLKKLPESCKGLDFENFIEAFNQRLAGDEQRSKRLVRRIQRGDERAVLFFANSVKHAEEVSARLNLAGVSAAAVSGITPTVARRYFLDRFQRGDIRVLCNHSVLSTGFDAPKTDMVLIARQVFSPVRYMQMVGRGLRGEKNGGTKCCRIVTVIDNLGRFQERHPYHYCQRYFSGWSEGRRNER